MLVPFRGAAQWLCRPCWDSTADRFQHSANFHDCGRRLTLSGRLAGRWPRLGSRARAPRDRSKAAGKVGPGRPPVRSKVSARVALTAAGFQRRIHAILQTLGFQSYDSGSFGLEKRRSCGPCFPPQECSCFAISSSKAVTSHHAISAQGATMEAWSPPRPALIGRDQGSMPPPRPRARLASAEPPGAAAEAAGRRLALGVEPAARLCPPPRLACSAAAGPRAAARAPAAAARAGRA